MMSHGTLFSLDESSQYIRKLENDFVHLLKAGLSGDQRDLTLASTRSLSEIMKRRPDLKTEIAKLTTLRGSMSRRLAAESSPVPVDADSRLQLLRRDENPHLHFNPTWPKSIGDELSMILREVDETSRLRLAGFEPTRSVLFVGPPGVGKSVAARWIAESLSVPLLTLDLSSVMSSYLGKTGSNVRGVLEYAKKTKGLLFLDEFDAIAKKRDDNSDVGELKRLVTVLLQEIDDWPSGNLLIAATNHPELLDSAIWRRFDRVLNFPLPSADDIRAVLAQLMGGTVTEVVISELAPLFSGKSFSDITKLVTRVRRESLLVHGSESDALATLIEHLCSQAPLAVRLKYAKRLRNQGRSERTISKQARVSRDTLRKKR
jgi:SpoVK/Ycf46/Vps4 family AAA+-type ATPase